MALINCKECNNEVSDTAKTCPKCGAKVSNAKKKIGFWGWAGILFVSYIFILSPIFRGARNASKNTEQTDTSQVSDQLKEINTIRERTKNSISGSQGNTEPPAPVFLRDDFQAAVIMKTPDEIIASVGRPDDTQYDGSRHLWFYKNRTKDPITGKIGANAVIIIENGRASGTLF